MANSYEEESARSKRLDDIETTRDLLREEVARGWRRNLMVMGGVLAFVAILWSTR